jgi:SAM-dependent methyltransferase
MQAEQFELNARIEQVHWWFRARRRVLRALIEQAVPPSRKTTVVDVGCGTGANIAALAGAYHGVGIDPSAAALRHAKRRFPHVRFVCGTAPDDLDERARTARLWMLNDVLEHVPDDFLLLSRILAAAEPGSHVLITVPADRSLWSAHDVSHGHYRRYDRPRLERLWQGLPVEARLVSHFNTRLYPAVKLVRTLNRWRGAAAGEAGTDLKLGSPLVSRTLERVFAGERRVLGDLLGGRRKRGYRYGVSLVALLQRLPGHIDPRSRPDDVPADDFPAPAFPAPAIAARTAS